ncbi:hypothetical protein E0198_000419 [Clavispora lusitaniae]|nr:hypothetical protein E0198_000419 [Clavispora lusitaniae]
MSFLTSARPLSKNVSIYSRASKYALTSLRYSSSKKSENDASEDVSQAKKPLGAVLKKRSGARKDKVQPEASTISATKETTQCYIPFDKLPKPPKEITDMPLDKFYAKVYMRDLPERPEITPSNTFSYKFEIPSQFIRPKRLDQETPNQKSSFEPAHNILDFKIDYDNSGLMKAPDHPLKESITGMFVSNPLMNNIDNDFLWDLYPKGKIFGHAPFGGNPNFDGFREWEKGENAKVKQKELQFEAKLQEMKEFNETLNETKSFYRKTAPEVEKAEPSSSKVETKKAGGRRKLDRSLLKQYRKYKKEGWLRRKLPEDDEDENF